ncbi:Membrane protein involved in the export of O-antigen, teichoic acid lipoteichoic acids [Rhodovastum atsumiense]|uniref:Flippase n=1 Tax=Rhodovastum atsumiense TaxID=504468 RepID=A0A5M6IY87_9PROT|nr:flippase [Rhodovastum atsumiense]KAA5613294.1 flippase [Rhodovastum atsumiense]CAH2600537.1 Membrane protein involved in the export of O-antigen, teichoic acid lipoteichoic acids [Rhodovastum atsumiense]
MRGPLLRNLAAMFAWQGMSYVLPLITLPYLARTLLPGQYGVLGFVNSIIAYFVLFTGWGFGLSATQQVAARRHDPAALTEIFWNTMFAKACLGVVSLLLLAGLVVAVPALRPYGVVLLLGWLQVLGSIMTADWFLQGLELMGRFATAAMIGRAVPIPFIFLLVHGPADVGMAVFLQALASIVAGGVSLHMAARTGRIGRPALSWRRMWHYLREGAALFLSSAATTLYINLNTIMVAAIAGPVQAGLFVGADKLRNAVQGLITPVSLVMYPHLAGLAAQDRGAMLAMVGRLLRWQGAFTAALSVATWVFAPLAVRLLLGRDFADAVDVLRALAPVPFLVGLSNVLGIQLLLPLGHRRDFLLMVALPGTTSLLYMPWLAWQYGAVGVAAALTVTEMIVNLVAVALLYRRRDELRGLFGPRPQPFPA